MPDKFWNLIFFLSFFGTGDFVHPIYAELVTRVKCTRKMEYMYLMKWAENVDNGAVGGAVGMRQTEATELSVALSDRQRSPTRVVHIDFCDCNGVFRQVFSAFY